MLTVQQAMERVMAQVPPLQTEVKNLAEATGHVLAEDVVSDINMPPFHKSAMDGFAVAARDVERVPVELEIVEELPAGSFPKKKLQAGQTARIMTGAPIPDGADAVVMVEKTQSVSPARVRILSSVKRGQHVCAFAEDLKEGEKVLTMGTLVRAQEVGALAAVGRARIKVYRKPAVSMIVTGDELVEVDEKPSGGKIRNSNGYSVSAQVRAMGLECRNLGIARDRLEDLRQKITEGLKSDVLILSGGVSVGEYDFVVEALKREGVEMVLHQVMIKPGRPFFFGTRKEKRIFALPGNPVSSFVIFEVFVRPFLGKMYGWNSAARSRIQATLASPVTKESDREQLLPAVVRDEHGKPVVEAIPWHGSADLFGLARCNSFVIVPPNTPRVEQGQSVSVFLLDPMNA